MTIQAQFLNIKWESSDEKLMLISSLSYSFGIKTETKTGASGNDKVVKKGYKKDSITVSYTVSRSCGCSPEREHSIACEIARSGKKGAFILGGKRFGPMKTMLLKVKPSNIMYAPDGRMLSLDLTLTFGEPEEVKEAKAKAAKKSSKKSTTAKKEIVFTKPTREAKKAI